MMRMSALTPMQRRRLTRRLQPLSQSKRVFLSWVVYTEEMFLRRACIYTLIFLGSISGHSAHASTCIDYLQRVAKKYVSVFEFKAPLFADLPSAASLELPRAGKQMIREHSIYTLRNSYGDGKGLTFAISHYQPDGALVNGMGESIQSTFVANTLKEIFPKAKFVGRRQDANAKAIELMIADRAEMPKTFGLDSTEPGKGLLGSAPVIDMTVLKPANPVSIGYTKAQLRKTYGVGSDKFAVSLYVQRLETPAAAKQPLVADILGQIESLKKPDIVFLSAGGGTIESLGNELQEAVSKNYETVRLSSLKPDSLEVGKRYLVLNDLRGKMPYIHCFSDLTFVSGPINLFESLAVGTPTIFLENIESLSGYHVPSFQRLAQQAKDTGGAFGIQSLNDMPGIFTQALDSAKTMTRPFQANSAQQKAFSAYLSDLERFLRLRLF